MMALRFRQFADAVGELQGLGEVLETKYAVELGDAVAVDQLPIRRLRVQRGDFARRNTGRIPATGSASFLG